MGQSAGPTRSFEVLRLLRHFGEHVFHVSGRDEMVCTALRGLACCACMVQQEVSGIAVSARIRHFPFAGLASRPCETRWEARRFCCSQLAAPAAAPKLRKSASWSLVHAG
jgi:hypothetical protein